MNYMNVFMFVLIFGGTWRFGRPTCVLESDFGFTLNCAFKKSGLFRVRNLGGVKAHIGLGFSLGDELGFKESLSNVENNRRRSTHNSQVEAQLLQLQQQKTQSDSALVKKSLSSAVPPFKPIPPVDANSVPTPAVSGAFNPPASISRASPQEFNPPKPNPSVMAVMVPIQQQTDKLSSTDFALRTLPSPTSNEVHSNLTEEYVQVISKKPRPKPVSRPNVQKFANSVGKVMNAPKEYYPVGYDKNFDDNFASRVELPETSFYCGDQKYFPGLYADEDLGCMVFHVCALTDDGLIMKSFLCPESTLFDQTILKCNWWFYVDCKSSRKLYDSNIPISKSYQLMKALTFFSGYKKDSATVPESKSKTDAVD